MDNYNDKKIRLALARKIVKWLKYSETLAGAYVSAVKLLTSRKRIIVTLITRPLLGRFEYNYIIDLEPNQLHCQIRPANTTRPEPWTMVPNTYPSSIIARINYSEPTFQEQVLEWFRTHDRLITVVFPHLVLENSFLTSAYQAACCAAWPNPAEVTCAYINNLNLVCYYVHQGTAIEANRAQRKIHKAVLEAAVHSYENQERLYEFQVAHASPNSLPNPGMPVHGDSSHDRRE